MTQEQAIHLLRSSSFASDPRRAWSCTPRCNNTNNVKNKHKFENTSNERRLYLCGAQRPRSCRDREAESDRAERAAVVLCGSMYSSAATIRPSARRYEKWPTSTIKSAKLEMMRSLRSTRLVTKPPHLTGRRPPSHDAAEAPRPQEKWLAGHHCRSVNVLDCEVSSHPSLDFPI